MVILRVTKENKMSKSVEETRRELFKEWFDSLVWPMCEKCSNAEYIAWEAFNAALDAVEIDLDPAIRTVGGGPIDGSMYTSEVYKAIESLNLGIKIRT
jgi:hypothetical protein